MINHHEKQQTKTTDNHQVKSPTSLCLSPICPAGCGDNGQCVKPGTCICQVKMTKMISLMLMFFLHDDADAVEITGSVSNLPDEDD